jgi:hypothetical protein
MEWWNINTCTISDMLHYKLFCVFWVGI